MSKRTAVVLLAVVAGAGVLSGQQAPQQPPGDAGRAVFRAEIDYVEVDAFVVDAQNAPVSDLKAEDFEVFEDGKPQKISAFSLVNIPVERPVRPLFADRPVEADVQTNDRGEGRVYMLVLDDLHTDFTRTPRVKAAARRFIEEKFGTNDIAAVVFTGRGEDAQDFTNNTRLLLRAIDRFQGQKLQSATINKLQGAQIDQTTGNIGPGPDND
jgi:VWFA-related protein